MSSPAEAAAVFELLAAHPHVEGAVRPLAELLAESCGASPAELVALLTAPAPPEVALESVSEARRPLIAALAGLLDALAGREEEARQARSAAARLRALTDTASDAIVTADADGDVVSWNGAAARLFGWSEAEMLGQPLTRIIPERHRSAHEAGMLRQKEGGPSRVLGRTVELAATRREGGELPIELSLARWSAEGQTFFTGILRDISERKAAEARQRELAERLVVSERAAVAASQAKSLFLANMSHELRTPLGSILGFVQLLDRDPRLAPDQREHLATVLRAGEHLLGLINDVLSIAKIEAGEATLEERELDLALLLESVRSLFMLKCHAKGLALSVSVAGPLPPAVRGDEHKLRQVLINLLGNAVKFTERGEVTLSARWAQGRAAFEVRDTGPGMSEAEVQQVFEPFSQAAAGQASQEGTGLGLTITRNLVSLLGGALDVETALGQGTTFRFSVPLPAAAAPVVRHDRRVLGIAPVQAPVKVLVVDNNEDNRRLLTAVMRSIGVESKEAANGAEAVALWGSWDPRLIWMDLRMPVLDGWQATRAIRERERADGKHPCAIVALTASAFEHDLPAVLSAGCDAVLTKPCRESLLFDALERYGGVQLRYEETGVATQAASALSVARLGALPAAVRTKLAEALTSGDDLAAMETVAEVAAVDESLAEALRAELKAFRFDEVSSLLERV